MFKVCNLYCVCEQEACRMKDKSIIFKPKVSYSISSFISWYLFCNKSNQLLAVCLICLLIVS
ncbi:unnamed protein product [Moneuplotes crassus]|uniref:Uncharacterized protein n=1 Tax=Euplotes crassus TaxID=5936 RepID=A0AAD1XBG7_EUPCR|nr:unnamed protein product [Moneuplotes crassus]